MPIIGLTGGIASGKTLVGNILEGLGAVCVDADVISHEVMQLGTPCYNALRAQFDDPFTDENGTAYTYLQVGTKAEADKYVYVTYNEIAG